MCLVLAGLSWLSLGDVTSLLAVTAAEPSLLEWLGSRAWMILQIGLGLGFVIFVHELGHFLVAKACGVKCDKFYIGFDIPMPKVFGWQIPSKLARFQWGETEYGIGILPLGGYVKMLGQDDDPRNAEKEAERTKVLKEGTAAEGLVSGQTVEKQYVLDPRSFPAKSVPARMAIISAGVIMNLIFAVVLAATAYRWGVPEAPAVIGRTAPGGPAWEANIPPGSKVLQFGRGGSPYEHLRWEDLRREVVLNGFDHKLAILVRTPDGREEWHEIVPSDYLRKVASQPTLGVVQQFTRKISPYDAAQAHLDVRSDVPLADGDRIVAIAGKELQADHQVNELLVQHPEDPLTITVERTEKAAAGSAAKDSPAKRLEIVIHERPMRTLGLHMQIGPIVAVRQGSPAAGAGFMTGDVIEAVNGEPVGDPLWLGQRLTPAPGDFDPIEFTVRRRDNKGQPTTRTIPVVPELPRQLNGSFSMGAVAVESIGIAFRVTPTVAGVEPRSPAAKANIKPGDVIVEAAFVPASDESRQREIDAHLGNSKALEPIELDEGLKTWTSVFAGMQNVLPDTNVKLKLDRNGKSLSAVMLPVDSERHFDESRGLSFYAQKEIHQADNWSDAVRLGLRETKDRLSEVLRVLGGLVTGNIPVSSLSGPLGIVYAAGTFADEGVPRTLIFLTLLSANLAVLNFLPIPALDGGHMLFLLAEWIRGKPVDERLQIRLTIAGVLALLSLMVFATVMDFGRFFG
jgi:regulator of sigma E protease